MDRNELIYLNRILPVIGHELRNKRLAFFNLELTHRIAEAFARCGVTKLQFFDEERYQPGALIVVRAAESVAAVTVGRRLDEVRQRVRT